MMTLLQVDTTEQRVNDNDDNDDDSDDHDDNDDNSDDHDDVDAGGLVHDRAEGEQCPGHDQRAQERACLSCCVATRGHGEYFLSQQGGLVRFFLSQQGGMMSVFVRDQLVLGGDCKHKGNLDKDLGHSKKVNFALLNLCTPD